MKSSLFISFALITSLVFSFCKKKESECTCRSLEDCIEDKCVLQKNAYYINNVGIKGINLYHGVIKGNLCIDTLVLDIGPESYPSNKRFAIFVDVEGYAVYDIAPSVISKISDNEFILGSAATCCYYFGQDRWNMSSIHCKVHKDSVNMKIWFRSDAQEPDDESFVDSCQVTLFK